MGFQQAISGLDAAQAALNSTGNSIANSGTVGFKESNPIFADSYVASLSSQNQQGLGVNVLGTSQDFSQGSISSTGNPTDMAINGNGFFQVSDSGGRTLYTRNGQFSLSANGSIVNQQGMRLMGFQFQNGKLSVGAPSPLSIPQSQAAPQATSKISISANLDSTSAQPTTTPLNPNDPTSYDYSTSINVYDSLGQQHQLSEYFVKNAAAGSWSAYSYIDGNSIDSGTPAQLSFDSSGNLSASSSLSKTYSAGNGSAPMNVTLDFSGSSQYGTSSSVSSLSQDGYAAGQPASFSISQDGVITQQFSNGQSKQIGQIALASVPAPQGLSPQGNETYSATSDSGVPVLQQPGTGGVGLVQSSALEQSNVDVATQLINLIQEQRAYQANAQTIKTEDQMMQTIINA